VPIVKHSEIKFWGKQIGKMIEMEVLQNRLSKHLTQLWSNDVFQKMWRKHKTITDKISRYFTPILLLIAL
jgi:Cu+-exporting ATPase